MQAELNSESERIVAEYDRRVRELPVDFYALHHPANLFIHQGHEAALLWGLRTIGAVPIADRRILDAGCWQGDWLSVLEDFGAQRDRLAGLELFQQSAETAAQRFEGADIRCGDAARVPWPDNSFDIVFQRMMASSILEPTALQQVVAEMQRVLKPGGAILWLDFAYNNPSNPNVRGVPPRSLRKLFPGSRVRVRRITLAPPLARRIVPLSWTVARMLEACRLFNTHYLAVIQPSRPSEA